ncbi:MAG: hypothetical protein ACFFC6_11695 [Promethearchaeota archaeon]
MDRVTEFDINPSEIDPSKIEREDQIIQTTLDLAGEFRAKMHELEYYKFLKPQNRVELEGIEQVIKNERLDPWLLKLSSAIKRRFLTNYPVDETTDESQESDIILALCDLWYSLKWDAFDATSKLILVEGIELLIDKEHVNPKLLRIVDWIKHLTKESIKAELTIEALREDRMNKNKK